MEGSTEVNRFASTPKIKRAINFREQRNQTAREQRRENRSQDLRGP